MQRDRNQVRVNAELIDAKSGGHLWAERFDKPLSSLFVMQDDIVASLASQLGAESPNNVRAHYCLGRVEVMTK